MPKGRSFTADERRVAAKAWVKATENHIKGADQRVEQFIESIFRYVKVYEPKDPELGRYSYRGSSNTFSFLRDKVFPDVHKFGQQ
jgi:hypothetical protein